jgi:hypothetical protein
VPPEGIDSLNADSLKGLVLSLVAKIDDLVEQNEGLLARIDEFHEQNKTPLARIAELEGRAGKPPKTGRTRRCRHRADRRPTWWKRRPQREAAKCTPAKHASSATACKSAPGRSMTIDPKPRRP